MGKVVIMILALLGLAAIALALVFLTSYVANLFRRHDD